MTAEPARAPREDSPLPVRLLRAWRTMPREHRTAVLGAVGLFISLFLPWYEETRFFAGAQVRGVVHATVTHSAISHFTFVEAAELLTAGGVLVLLFARAERRAFHLPGGDGLIVTAAGAWALLLVVWRFFDKPDFGSNASAGLHWGVLGPLVAGVAIVYAGLRMRAAHRPEPALPGDGAPGGPAARAGRRRRRAAGSPAPTPVPPAGGAGSSEPEAVPPAGAARSSGPEAVPPAGRAGSSEPEAVPPVRAARSSGPDATPLEAGDPTPRPAPASQPTTAAALAARAEVEAPATAETEVRPAPAPEPPDQLTIPLGDPPPRDAAS